MTARGPDPARRRDARLMARAERMRAVEGISLKRAARKLRADRVRVTQAAKGEITPQLMLRVDLPPELRKELHDARRGAVRS